MNPLPFWKMHGTGNDFVVAWTEDASRDWSKMAVAISDRHFGVGADGLILAMPSSTADCRMRIFNPDGSEAEMCGNGIRCLVKFVLDRGIVDAPKGSLRVETGAGVLDAVAQQGADGLVECVSVLMGRPAFEPSTLGARVEQAPPVLDLPLEVAGESLALTLVSMGNPHAVALLDGPPAEYPVQTVGPAVEHHPLFERRTNVEFVRVIGRDEIEMRVWERGVGETLACGSGACAAVVAARLHEAVDDRVAVRLRGGMLDIEWDGEGEIRLTGPAVRVFESVWDGA